MANHTFGPEYGFATRAVHTGNDIDQDSGAIKRPITMANSYALPYDPTDMNWSSADTSDPANVEAAIRPNTKLIHIETPGNPTLCVRQAATHRI